MPAGVLEPGDVRARVAEDPFLILSEAVVALEPHATCGERVDGRVDVVDREVQDRVVRGRVVGLRVDQRLTVAGDVERQQPVLHRRLEPERIAVEPARLVDVVNGEAAERPGVGEHVALLSVCADVDRRRRGNSSPRRGIVPRREHDRRQCRAPPRARGPGGRARAAAGELARHDAGDVGRTGRSAVGALPGRALRPPRPRRLAGPAGALLDRRARPRRARAARRARDRARVLLPASRSAAWSACGWPRTRPSGSTGSWRCAPPRICRRPSPGRSAPRPSSRRAAPRPWPMRSSTAG